MAGEKPASGRSKAGADRAGGERRYMVVRLDTHGSKYLIAGDLSEDAADAALATLLARQTKPHHQTYVIYDYDPARRGEFMSRMDILE